MQFEKRAVVTALGGSGLCLFKAIDALENASIQLDLLTNDSFSGPGHYEFEAEPALISLLEQHIARLKSDLATAMAESK